MPNAFSTPSVGITLSRHTSGSPSGSVDKNRELAKEGKPLREEDLRRHITKVSEKMKSIKEEGKSLLSEGKAESPEYDALIEKHRMLRGKQRFFEDILKDVSDTGATMSSQGEKNADRAIAERSRKAANESTVEALDRLKSESEEEQ